jgi:dipeptidyl aminopeptidase/acylaminoacyl peptidase
MRTATLLLVSLLTSCAGIPPQPQGTSPAPTGVQRTERGALVIENIPDIPPALAERTYQYQQTRGASLRGWLDKGVLLATRFADTSQIHHVAFPGADRRQLTFFPEPVSGATAAPDGKSFLFTKDVGGDEYFQIHHYDLATGAQRLLTDGKSRNASPLWSDRGERFAFSTTRRNGKDTDIHVMALGATDSTPLVELEGNWSPADWSPDGTKLLVVKFISINETELYVADVTTRALTRFHPSDQKIAFFAARFSRDGKGVYYTSDENSEFQRLRYEPLEVGAAHGRDRGRGPLPQVLSADIDWDVEELELSDDGRTLAFTVNAGGVVELHLRNLRTGKPIATPKLPIGLVTALEFDRAGRRLGFVVNGPRSSSDVFSFEVGQIALTRWTRSETAGLDAATFTEPKLIEFASFDGRKIPAFYYRPAAPKQPGGTFPVLISIHGGPESQTQPSFSALAEFYVRELGLALLAPNVRGSSGYGKSYLLLDNGEKREDSVKDIGALLDWIAQQPELDATRVAVTGGSYGGYMTLAAMTHYNDRLRAGIDIVGISNFVTFLTNTKDYRRDLRRVEYGDERDPAMRAFLEKISPNNNAHKITKPMLIVQGANDPRVPQGEAEQMVATIRRQGGDVWYLLAKDEGHGFQKKPNRDYQQNATVLFLQKHLIGP